MLPLLVFLFPASALAASGSAPADTVTTTPCDNPIPGSGNELLCECYSTAKAESFSDLYAGVSGSPVDSYASGYSCFHLDHSLNNAGIRARNKYGSKFRSVMWDAEAVLIGMSYTFGGSKVDDFGLRDSDGDWLNQEDEAFMSAEGGMDPTNGGGGLPIGPPIQFPPVALDPAGPGHWILTDEFGNPTGDVFGDPTTEIRAAYSTDVGEDGILDFAIWTEDGRSYELHSIQPGSVYDLNAAIPEL